MSPRKQKARIVQESDGLSGSQKGARNFKRFEEWIAERNRSGDWSDYLNGAKLSRVDIAHECEFGTSAFSQNPRIAKKLEEIELRFRAEHAQDNSEIETEPHHDRQLLIDSQSAQAVANRLNRAKSSADERIKKLEEENAALRAENGDLRSQIKQFRHWEDHLAETGRVIMP